MFSIKAFALLGFALGATASAAAQSVTPHGGIAAAEIAVDYSYVRANATPGQCGCFHLNGGSAEAATHVFRDFSLVADITGDHTATTSIRGQSLSLISYTGGPRFSDPLRRSQRTRITPFVQGLVGAIHGFDAPFPNGSLTLSTSANALAVLVGGGIDVPIGHTFAVRAVQVDYGLNHLPNNANNRQNLIRVSTGVVFRIH